MCPKSSYRLKNGFYPLNFMAAILSRHRDFSLLPHQPAKRLCATCVIFLFGTEFGLCILLRCAGCFFTLSGRLKTYFTAEFPPSADIAAPVIKLLIGLTKNKIVAAISSGRAMRLTACSPSAHARC